MKNPFDLVDTTEHEPISCHPWEMGTHNRRQLRRSHRVQRLDLSDVRFPAQAQNLVAPDLNIPLPLQNVE